MRFLHKSVWLVLALAFAFSNAPARQTPTQTAAAKTTGSLSPAEIIQRFAASESENKIARENYAFTQDLDLSTVGMGGNVTGRLKRISDIVLDNQGQRIEKITFFPPSTLAGLTFTTEDMRDLAGVQPFALTLEDIPKYQIDYVGKEKIDELNTYIFDVKPKQIKTTERYFQGRIWVDDQDLQIVKAAGQAVPEVKDQKFPHFETYRENIDGKYWFPTYVYIDDSLDFKNGSIHLRGSVKYTNYKKFSTGIKMADEGEAAREEETKQHDQENKTAPAGTEKDPGKDTGKQKRP